MVAPFVVLAREGFAHVSVPLIQGFIGYLCRSSVGTLILLYFTLSMSKMSDAGSGAEGAVSDAR
jgi:hypothetical protein